MVEKAVMLWVDPIAHETVCGVDTGDPSTSTYPAPINGADVTIIAEEVPG
jgi:hypothetical protein